MSFAVSVRTRELGVRAALGASPRDLMRLSLRSGAGVTGVAVTLGLIASFAATGLLRAMLFGVTPRDPFTFAVVAGMLTTIALVATWIPARRVLAADPVRALRDVA
jgi:ABC-type antimicrobial peptide transport system permease subunit